MEFWLIGNQGKDKFHLPVPPGDFKILNEHDIQTVNLNELGDMPIKADRKPFSISLSSFFPSVYYPFCQTKDFPKPYDCVKKIENWKEGSYPIRLLVTETNINRLFYIQSFEYGEKAGSRDVEFTLTLIEYRFFTNSAISQTSTTKDKTKRKRTSEGKVKAKTYTIKPGDSLFIIARKPEVYGDGSRWKELARKNNIKDPKKLQVGKVLVV